MKIAIRSVVLFDVPDDDLSAVAARFRAANEIGIGFANVSFTGQDYTMTAIEEFDVSIREAPAIVPRPVDGGAAELFAWTGRDASGDLGLKTILAIDGDGVMPACFARLHNASHPTVIFQLQIIANESNQTMHLHRFTRAEAIRTLTPQPQG